VVQAIKNKIAPDWGNQAEEMCILIPRRSRMDTSEQVPEVAAL